MYYQQVLSDYGYSGGSLYQYVPSDGIWYILTIEGRTFYFKDNSSSWTYLLEGSTTHNMLYKVKNSSLTYITGELWTDNLPYLSPPQVQEYLLVSVDWPGGYYNVYHWEFDNNPEVNEYKWFILNIVFTGYQTAYFIDVVNNVRYSVSLKDPEVPYDYNAIPNQYPQESLSSGVTNIVGTFSNNPPIINGSNGDYILVNNYGIYHYTNDWYILINYNTIYFEDSNDNNKTYVFSISGYLYDIISTSEQNIIGVMKTSIPNSTPSSGEEYQLITTNSIGGYNNIYHYESGKWHILNFESLYFIDSNNIYLVEVTETNYVYTVTLKNYPQEELDDGVTNITGIIVEKSPLNNPIDDNDKYQLVIGDGIYHYIDEWYILIGYTNIYFCDINDNNKMYVFSISGNIYDIMPTLEQYIVGILKTSIPITQPSSGEEYQLVSLNDIGGYNNIYYYFDNKWFILNFESIYFTNLTTRYFLENSGVDYQYNITNNAEYPLVDLGDGIINITCIIIENKPLDIPEENKVYQLLINDGIYYYDNNWFILSNYTAIYFTNSDDDSTKLYTISKNIYDIISTSQQYIIGVIKSSIPISEPSSGEEFQLIDNNNVGEYNNIYHYESNKWSMLTFASLYFTNITDRYLVTYSGSDYIYNKISTTYPQEELDEGVTNISGIIVDNPPIQIPESGEEYQLVIGSGIYHYNNNWFILTNYTSVYFNNNSVFTSLNNLYEINSSSLKYIVGIINTIIPIDSPSSGEEYQLINNNNIGGYNNIYWYNNNKWEILSFNFLYFTDLINKYLIESNGINKYTSTQDNTYPPEELGDVTNINGIIIGNPPLNIPENGEEYQLIINIGIYHYNNNWFKLEGYQTVYFNNDSVFSILGHLYNIISSENKNIAGIKSLTIPTSESVSEYQLVSNDNIGGFNNIYQYIIDKWYMLNINNVYFIDIDNNVRYLIEKEDGDDINKYTIEENPEYPTYTPITNYISGNIINNPPVYSVEKDSYKLAINDGIYYFYDIWYILNNYTNLYFNDIDNDKNYIYSILGGIYEIIDSDLKYIIGIRIFSLPVNSPSQSIEKYQLLSNNNVGGFNNVYEYNENDSKWYMLNLSNNTYFVDSNNIKCLLETTENIYEYNILENVDYPSESLDLEEITGIIIQNPPILIPDYGSEYQLLINIGIYHFTNNWYILNNYTAVYFNVDTDKYLYTIIHNIYNVVDSPITKFNGIINTEIPNSLITEPEYILVTNNNVGGYANIYHYVDDEWVILNTASNINFFDTSDKNNYTITNANTKDYTINIKIYPIIDSTETQINGIIVSTSPIDEPEEGQEIQLVNSEINDGYGNIYKYVDNTWYLLKFENNSVYFNNMFVNNIGSINVLYYNIEQSQLFNFDGLISFNFPNNSTLGYNYILLDNNLLGGYGNVYHYNNGWNILNLINPNIYFTENTTKYFVKNVGHVNYELELIENINSIYNGYVYINSNNQNYNTLINNPKNGDYYLVNNTNNITLLKYINNTFTPIIINNYIFYSNNGDIINDYKPSRLYINNNNITIIDNFDTETNVFNGIIGNVDPNNSISGAYYLNITTGKIFYYYNNWINLVTTLTKFIYITDTNRYIVYIPINSLTPTTPILINLDTNIYQGFFTDLELNNNTEVINEIKSIKCGRDIKIGDTLIYKNDGIYKIYSYGYSVDNLSNIKCIYYNLGDLQILYVNNNTVSEYLNYFDQTKSIFNGTYGVNEPNTNTPKDREYISFKYNTIYIFYNGNWMFLIMSLYKYNFNDLLVYCIYYQYVVGIYTVYNNNSNIGKYQGYYSTTPLPMPTSQDLISQVNIIASLQLIKENYVEIGDCLLLKDQNGGTYTSKILLNGNNLNINSSSVNNITFFNVDGNKVYSQIVNNNNIQQMDNFNLNINNFNLDGYIIDDSQNLDGIGYSELYLFTKSIPYLQQGINSLESYPVIPNNKYLTFTQDYKIWTIKTKLDNTVTIRDITPPEIKPTYQGYYTDIIIDNPSDEQIKNKILELSTLHNIYPGDSLLMNNILYTVVNYSQINNNLQINNVEINKVLYYSNNQNGDYKSKILFIYNESIILLDNFNSSNKTLSGYVNNKPQNRQINSFYLDTSNFILYRFANDILAIVNLLTIPIKDELISYINNLISNDINIIQAYTCTYTYNYLDLFNNNILNVNIDTNNNSPVIFNTEGDKYMYNGNYQAYYSNNNNITTFNQNILLSELETVKQQKAIIGDFLLIKINNYYTVLRFNSINPLNITPLSLPNKYLYYNLTNKNILLIDNNIITITNLQFDVTQKVFNGYMEGVKNKEDPPQYIYYIDIQNNLFQSFYNNSWIYTFLGLYIYNFSVNPFFTITNKYINNSLIVDGIVNVISVKDIPPYTSITNSINFEGDILSDFPNVPIDMQIISINNNTYKCGIYIFVEDINQWAYYNPLPIMKFNNQYLHNVGNDFYFISNEANFSGIIIKDYNIITQEYNNDNIYKLGDISLLMDDSGNINNGKVYQLSYNPDTLTYPYIWSVLCEEQSYFTDSRTCVNYFVNNIGINAYIIERHSTNYYIGKINSDYIENEYYIYNNNICIYENDELKQIAKNNEPFEFYNLLDSKTYVFNGTLLGLKEYSGYTLKVNNINNNLPSINYKNNTFCLVYDTSNLNINTQVIIYKKQGIYEEVDLLDKTFYKDISNGKIYIIKLISDNIGRVTEIVKSKLLEAVVSKYVNDFDTETKSVNLLKSSSRVFTQNVYNSGYIKFNPQPPTNAKYTENNKCSVVLKNNEWWFDIKDSNVSIIFEYYENGVNYNLIYNIIKHINKNKILASATFSGDFNFSDMNEINNKQIMLVTYILDYKFPNNYIADGIINIPENGIYNIIFIINYQYDTTVPIYVTEAPYYSLNYFIPGYPELIKYLVCITNYNTPSKKLYTPISNGTITINAILNLQKDDQIILIYTLNGCEMNIKYLDNSWITLTKIN